MAEQRKSFRDLGKLGKKLKGKKAALEDFIPVFHSLIDDIEARGKSFPSPSALFNHSVALQITDRFPSCIMSLF